MQQLPVFEITDQLKTSLSEHPIVILQAPPGAGKSTGLPLKLLQEPWLQGKKILMLEPRRIAARNVALRLAEQLHEEIGEQIGYRVRFENKVSAKTKLEILTEGILTRMLQQDNALEHVGLVIFDEFHERSLHADLAFTLCREIQSVLRDDLRILIMSATLDGKELSAQLNDAPVIVSEGRQFPVTINYRESDEKISIAENVVKTIRIALNETSGDILAFLPGSGDIHRAQQMLEEQLTGISVQALYGDLSFDKQQAALLPDKNGRRKVVLATSIAETSLTIQGITTVVDSGYSRIPRFDHKSGFTKLETVPVSKDTADQRAGRAGRLGPGTCYRLWNAAKHLQLAEKRKPEILEADFAPTLLELYHWGESNIEQLKWITPPPPASVSLAKKVLIALHAIEGNKITAEGKHLLSFPTHPRIAHLLHQSHKHQLTSLAADVAALLEEKDPLSKMNEADISLRINALIQHRKGERNAGDKNTLDRIERLSRQWRSSLKCEINHSYTPEDVGFLLMLAYPERIGKKINDKGKFRLATGKLAKVSELDPIGDCEWIVAASLDAGQQEGKIFLAAPLDISELKQQAKSENYIEWNERDGSLVAKKILRFGEIILSEQPLTDVPEEEKTKAICRGIKNSGLDLLDWTDECIQLKHRVFSYLQWYPGSNFPSLRDEDLLEQLEEWLEPHLNNVKNKSDLKKLNLNELLQLHLGWENVQELNRICPDKLKVPSGSEIKLQYQADGSYPILAVRLQECFGLSDTPTVNQGKKEVLMHLLSPGYKPVQITRDLRSFWNNTYQEIRKELRIRYPRHSWPEDPWTAEAIRGAKKRNQS